MGEVVHSQERGTYSVLRNSCDMKYMGLRRLGEPTRRKNIASTRNDPSSKVPNDTERRNTPTLVREGATASENGGDGSKKSSLPVGVRNRSTAEPPPKGRNWRKSNRKYRRERRREEQRARLVSQIVDAFRRRVREQARIAANQALKAIAERKRREELKRAEEARVEAERRRILRDRENQANLAQMKALMARRTTTSEAGTSSKAPVKREEAGTTNRVRMEVRVEEHSWGTRTINNAAVEAFKEEKSKPGCAGCGSTSFGTRATCPKCPKVKKFGR